MVRFCAPTADLPEATRRAFRDVKPRQASLRLAEVVEQVNITIPPVDVGAQRPSPISGDAEETAGPEGRDPKREFSELLHASLGQVVHGEYIGLGGYN
jgi:hypothetical protein